MRIKLKYPDLDTFIQKYAVNISRGGIFIATKTPKPVGTVVKFEFLLANAEATSLIRGEGMVQWTREFDPATPQKAHGMGVKFTRLDADSQAVVDRALAWRASHGMVKKGDSEGINVQSTVPPGATPEPMAMPPSPIPAASPPAPPAPAPPPARATASLGGEDDAEPTQVAPTASLKAERDEPTMIEPPPGRAAHDPTRPVDIDHATAQAEARARAGDRETRPIQLPDVPREETTGEVRLPDDSVRITLERHRRSRNGRSKGDDLDALAAEWGLSEERLERVLRRKRPRMVEATAELERLLRKPPKPPAPSRADAIRLLRDLLERAPPSFDELRDSPAAQAARGKRS
jgi:uncharacterized protein (TIGR02266 family)